jgi:hypothetical protein
MGSHPVRTRSGDRPHGVDRRDRAVPPLRAHIDDHDGLHGLAVRRRDRACHLAANHPMQPGKPAGVGGRLGPVRGGHPRGTVIDHYPGEGVRRLEPLLHVQHLDRLRAGRQPGTRVVLLRTGELPGQRESHRHHDHPKAHHQPLGPAPRRNLRDPAQLAHRSPPGLAGDPGRASVPVIREISHWRGGRRRAPAARPGPAANARSS